MKKSDIHIGITLDENHIAEDIEWTAKDGGIKQQKAKAMILALWDSKEKETMRIDLWTKDMPLEEMKLFFHQTLVTMADTYMKATNDDKMTATMRDFCDYFSEKLGLKKKL